MHAAMANSLRHRIGSLLLRSPAHNHLHPLIHRQAAGAVTSSKRFFSGDHHDDIEEAYKWRKITAAAYVASIGMMFYTFAGNEHEHDEDGHAERPAYSYLRIRKKEFPWGPNGLFEFDED